MCQSKMTTMADDTVADTIPQPVPEGYITGVTETTDKDVLCGRGAKLHRHPGNVTHREYVSKNKLKYIECVSTNKNEVSKSIVTAMRQQGARFLQKDESGNTWHDIGDKKAIDKTSQALRENQIKFKEENKMEGQNNKLPIASAFPMGVPSSKREKRMVNIKI